MYTKYTRALPSEERAWTLVEMMVTVALFSLAGLALLAIFLFSIRSFASMANYATLDRDNREAMDRLTREIRQARQVTNYETNSSGNSIQILNGDGQLVTFTFDLDNKRLMRTDSTSSSVLLTNCDLLSFNLFQRNPSNANFGVFPVAYENWTQTVKVVQLKWKTQRHVPSAIVNSENIQTARIVIRKQQDN